MYQELFEEISKAQTITIFRHQKPDGDALFSALGLRRFILDNFPGKKVCCVGNDLFQQLPYHEDVDDETIASSLALVVDCSDADRTDDLRLLSARKVIIIDHHPGSKPEHADLFFLDTQVAACCEFLAKIFYSSSFQNCYVSPKTCEYLYCGIMTDSLCFRTSSTTPDTLLYGSRLMREGNLKGCDLYDWLFGKSLDYFKKETLFRSYLKIVDKVGYVALSKEDLDTIGMDYRKAKNSIDQFSIIKEINVWAVFAYNEKDGWYDGSIRSRRGYVINELCTHFNGGGHKNACGVKRLNEESIKDLVSQLSEIAQSEPVDN